MAEVHSSALRAGFVLEQSLGHVTHSKNLIDLLPPTDRFLPTFRRIEYDVTGWAARVPGFGSNWTIRAGMRARRAIRSLVRTSDIDVLFVHTQVPATLAGRWLTKVPAVVSIDATPLQYDGLGAAYSHERGGDRVEAVKHRMHRACFHRAAHVVSWSQWGRQGLIDDYGVDPARITVIAPGVNLSLWSFDTDRQRADDVIRVLFVGGDLRRKGGDVLIEAFTHLRAELAVSNPSIAVELHLVTNEMVDAPAGVFVYRGVAPNSAELIELYRQADMFCLPTVGDCLPMVLSEAGAAGLPLVSTAVGAIPEIVRPGETGLLIEPGDVRALSHALRTLALDGALRSRLGENARRLVADEFDARQNAGRIVGLLEQLAPRAALEERRP